MSRAEPQSRLTVRRWYEAAPEHVFQAFTEAQWLEQWFCPAPDVTVAVTALDVRVGGDYRLVFEFPDRHVAVVIGTYRSVEPPRRLEFTWTWEPPDPHAGVETLVTVELAARDGGTALAVTHVQFPTEPLMRQHESGWGATLDRLQELLARPVRPAVS